MPESFGLQVRPRGWWEMAFRGIDFQLFPVERVSGPGHLLSNFSLPLGHFEKAASFEYIF